MRARLASARGRAAAEAGGAGAELGSFHDFWSSYKTHELEINLC